MTQPRVLIIDDDTDMSKLALAVAGDMGFDAVVCSDLALLKDAYRTDLSAIIVDVATPHIDGGAVLRFLAAQHSRAGIILLSDVASEPPRSMAKLARERNLNLVGVLQTPFVPENLAARLTKAKLASAARRLHGAAYGDADAMIPSEDELLVMFQPKIDMQSLDFTSVEALVRWQHPTRGLLGPGAFIPAAEDSGHIDTLSDRIFHKTLAQCSQWIEENLIITTSMNLSTHILSDATLPDRLADMLVSYRVEPSQIILEIRETWLGEDPVNCLDSLTRLAQKGFSLSIDDFGTGDSSLSQLSRIPFSELKIDRSFVKHAPFNAQARRIVESSVALGHHLDMNVVAEGVETQDHWSLVRETGCDECQGFFIARPLPAGSTPAWLERWASMVSTRKMDANPAVPTESSRSGSVKM